MTNSSSSRLRLLVGVLLLGLGLSALLTGSGTASHDPLAPAGSPGDPATPPEPRVGPLTELQHPTWRGMRLAVPTDPVDVMIELEDPPAVEVYAKLKWGSDVGKRTSTSTNTERLNARTPERLTQAVRVHIAHLEAAQERLREPLTGSPIHATVISRSQRVYNGIAVQVQAGKLNEVRQLPGVEAVHVMMPLTLATRDAVPFIGAPTVWTGNATVKGATGAGVKVAVIDTGTDYTFRSLGGSGNPADYTGNNPTVIEPGTFPTAKVAGGHDFVGENFDGSSADPERRRFVPDPDPLDLNGHGTMASDIIAGLGLNADGSLFRGPYDRTTPFSTLRLSPGVAPGATLYALKVLGRTGTTNDAATIQALEWTVDPDADGDFDDRMDVISFGFAGIFTPQDAPVVAATNGAALTGVIPVGPTGNAGDTFFIAGGPAMAPLALAVGATYDNGYFYQILQINRPANLAGPVRATVAGFSPALEAPLTADLALVTPADGCAAPTNAALLKGKIAVLDPGTCFVSAKVRNVQAAGAVAAILVNTTAELPLFANGGTDSRIPLFVVSKTDGDRLKATLAAGAAVNVTISPDNVSRQPQLANTLAPFSSWGGPSGPTVTSSSAGSTAGIAAVRSVFNWRNIYGIKPDCTGPGGNVPAAWRGSGDWIWLYNGASVASPFWAAAVACCTELSRRNPQGSGSILSAQKIKTYICPSKDPYQGSPNPYGYHQVGAGPPRMANPDGTSYTLLLGEDRGRRFNVGFDSSWGAAYECVSFNSTTGTLGQITAQDGSSNTLVVGETVEANLSKTSGPPGVALSHKATGTVGPEGWWYSPVNATCDPRGMKNGPRRQVDYGFGSYHAGEPNWLMADGSVHFTRQNIDLRIYGQMATRAGGDMTIGSGFLDRRAGPSIRQRALNLTAETGTLQLQQIGQGVHTGNNFPIDVISLVSPFELQQLSPNEPLTTGTSDHSDLKAVGVRAYRPQAAATQSLFRIAQQPLANARLLFGIATHANWRTPNEVAVNIFIDTNRDGTDDFRLFNTSFPNVVGAPSDGFLTRLQNLRTGAASTQAFLNVYSPAQFDTVPFNTNVMVLSMAASALGLTEANARFTYQVRTAIGGVVVDQSARLTYDPTRPGLDFGSSPMFFDLPGRTIPVTYDRPNLRANASQGGLLIHHHNITGKHDQVLLVAN